MKRTRTFLLAIVVLGATVACVTKRQVEEIVATSNAAMVDVPDLLQAGEDADETQLKDAVARIETIIAAHPDQTVLVNTLRVRQAMMLTVWKKLEAAKIVWGKTSRPVGERDRALFDLRKELVWWFGAASSFKDSDVGTGNAALATFAETCDGLTPGSGIRGYLETMRASIGLQVANKTSTVLTDNEARRAKKAAVAGAMAATVQRLAGQFDTRDADWIKANWDSNAAMEEVPIALVRARVELRALLRQYFGVARTKTLGEFDPVPWKSEWVAELAARAP